MSIEKQIEAGRALRTTRPDVQALTTPTPASVDALLITLARAQLGRWIDGKADYAHERTRLIQEYVTAARAQYPRENDSYDYVAAHQGHYLGVFDRFERTALPAGNRRELIRDCTARWLWLHKRHEFFGKRDPVLGNVTPQDCDEAANNALDVEIQRRRK